jgi:hypothetical protein
MMFLRSLGLQVYDRETEEVSISFDSGKRFWPVAEVAEGSTPEHPIVAFEVYAIVFRRFIAAADAGGQVLVFRFPDNPS